MARAKDMYWKKYAGSDNGTKGSLRGTLIIGTDGHTYTILLSK
jgi:hypothetical protein